METLDQIQKLIDVLKSQQQKDEKPLDTLFRVLMPTVETPPTEPAPVVTPPTVEPPVVPQPPTPAPAPQPVPETPPQPTGPLYRFKTHAQMNKGMTEIFGVTWQSSVNQQGLLDRLYGYQPTDPAVQASLHKTYTSQPDTGSGFVQLDDGKQALYVKMMLEKIS